MKTLTWILNFLWEKFKPTDIKPMSDQTFDPAGLRNRLNEILQEMSLLRKLIFAILAAIASFICLGIMIFFVVLLR
jgi:hypothetical protein